MSDQENGVARFAFYMVPAAMLLIALLPLPYGYYTLLRLVVCICAGIIVVTHFNHAEKISASVVVAFMIALVFNPIVPVYLKRDAWAVIDVISAGLFGWLAYIQTRLDASSGPTE